MTASPARTAAARRLLAAAVALAPLSLAAQAPKAGGGAAATPARSGAGARWQQIGQTGAGNPVELDSRSVRRANGIVTATIRTRYEKPMRSNRGPITSARTVAMFDCAKRHAAVKENTYYHDERANRVYEHRVVGQPGFATVLGGSATAVALAHLCPP